MVSNDDKGEDLVSEVAASAFLERASALESGADLRWRHLREGALAAGFSPASVVQAEAETREVERDQRCPDWVRFSLVGVPNREAAQFWYHLLSAAGVVSGALALLRSPLIDPVLGLAGAAWFFGCAVASSSAIRWMDRHRAWASRSGG
jgi:hypothetical protein